METVRGDAWQALESEKARRGGPGGGEERGNEGVGVKLTLLGQQKENEKLLNGKNMFCFSLPAPN